MFQADSFINLCVPKEEFIIVKQYGENYYTGRAKDLDLREVSPYDIMKIESTSYTKQENDKTATIYPNVLEITIG